MISADTIMSISPCRDWPRPRIERALEQLDTSSWTALIESVIQDDWRIVSLPDLWLALYRYAAQHYLSVVLTPWVVEITTGAAIEARLCYPGVLLDRLAAWQGDREEILAIQQDAVAADIQARSAHCRGVGSSAAAYAAALHADIAYSTDVRWAQHAHRDKVLQLCSLARRLDAASK